MKQVYSFYKISYTQNHTVIKLFCATILFILQPIIIWSQNENFSNVIEIDNLVRNYENFFIQSKEFIDVVSIDEEEINSKGTWSLFYNDNQILDNQTFIHSNFPVLKTNIGDLGLKLVFNASHNFRSGISEIEDLYYLSRFSTGLDWNILGEGSWLKRKKDLELFKTQIQIDSLVHNQKNVSTSIDNKQQIVQYIFDTHRVELLIQYRDWLILQASYNEKMYEQGLLRYPEKLKTEQRVSEINNKINVYESYLLYWDRKYPIGKYNLIPYDIEDLPEIQSIRNLNLLKSVEAIVQLQNDLALEKYKNSRKPNIRAQVRYNYYDAISHTGKSHPSIGASATIPIDFNKKSSILEYEASLRENELINDKQTLIKNLIYYHRHFYELKNDLNEIMNEMAYIKALMDNELKIYREMFDDFSPSNFIKLTKEYVQKRLLILDIKQALFETYLTFYSLSGLNPLESKSQEGLSINSYNDSVTYLWKNSFVELSNEKIIQILLINKISKVFLSPGENVKKAQEFIELCKTDGIEVHRLISENSYADLDDNNIGKLINKLEDAKSSNYSGVHLNIEPHVRDDYKLNIDDYINQMDIIYNLASNWCEANSLQLSVSIPMHLPEKNAKTLNEKNITAFIMAYGNSNTKSLLKRTESLRQILGENFVWVVHLEDFKDNEELENAEQILKEQGIKQVGYYHFSLLNH